MEVQIKVTLVFKDPFLLYTKLQIVKNVLNSSIGISIFLNIIDNFRILTKKLTFRLNKRGLQPVSRPVEQVLLIREYVQAD